MNTAPQTPTLDTPAVLELREIKGGYGRTIVVDNLTLTVPPSSVVALLGPNGAGKTTVLRIASGLLKPKAGQIHLGGTDVTGQDPHRLAKAGLCLIPEGRGIFRSLTVRDNLLLQIPPWSRTTTLERAIDAFPILGSRLNQLAGSMSGGEQQMLALGRAYLSDPRVVLLDEVSMGLAPMLVNQIFESLQNLAHQGLSLLLVEQYVNRALEMADLIYLMNQGSITYSGNPSELDQEAVMRSYLRHDVAAEPGGGRSDHDQRTRADGG